MTTSAPPTRTFPARALPVVTGSFAVMLFSANTAAPLYASYARRFGFSPLTLTLVFAIYALVLLPSLLLFGQLSDRYGRRRMILSGLAVAVVALALFACARGTGWLLAARASQGAAQGMMSGAATAALAEVDQGSDRRRPALLATLAQAGGSAAGVLVAGCLAQWTPWPFLTPFVVGIVACLALMAALCATPVDPRDAPHAPGRPQMQRPHVPPEVRGPFVRVGVTAAVVWAVAGGLFLGVMPSSAAEVLSTSNLAVIGAVTALMLACSCAAQLVVSRRGTTGRTQGVGLLLVAVGLACLVAAMPLAAWLLGVGAAAAGCGHGVAFLAAQDDLTRLAPPGQRAEISAAFYVCIYLGVAVPVIGIGLVSTLTGSLFAGVAGFAGLMGAFAIATAGWQLHHHRPERTLA